jgi:hypothetical protein
VQVRSALRPPMLALRATERRGQFLSVTVCDKTLDNSNAGSCTPVTEAVCSNSNDAGKNNQAFVQLIAQLTAAKLNPNATDAIDGDSSSFKVCLGRTNPGTDCTNDANACTGGGPCLSINDVISAWDRTTICNGSQAIISSSGCIEPRMPSTTHKIHSRQPCRPSTTRVLPT